VDKSKFLRSVGERIAEERARLGLTQAEVADFGAVTRRTQINYETGARAPDAAYLKALENAGFDALYILVGRRESSDANAGFGVAEPAGNYVIPGLKPANVRAAALAVFEAVLQKAVVANGDSSSKSMPNAERVAEAIVVLANMSESVEDVRRNAVHVLQLLK
jgi:DNA-binding XRE family transcriptional regulator